MKIIKLGGSNFSDIIDFYSLIDFINGENDKILIVISAFGKLSSQLSNYTLEQNNTNISNSPLNIFLTFTPILNEDIRKEFEQYLDNVNNLIQNRLDGAIATNELHNSVVDEIIGYGEIVSSYFIYCLLKSNNIGSDYLDSRELIKTNNDFGNAKPLIDKSIANIQAKLSNANIHLAQGFIASNSEGRTSTMGFESSNLSAMIYAKAVAAKEIEIFTKVNQIKTYDPQLISNTKAVNKLPYSSAKVLADNNFKLLFPGMIDMAQKSGIVITYRGLANWEQTLISQSEQFDYPVIFPKNDSEIIIAPINMQNSILLLNEFKDRLLEFNYDKASYSLQLITKYLNPIEIHNFVISLF